MTTSGERQLQVLTVSQLTALIQGVLESTFHSLWVRCEFSEVSRPHSGHVYFTLKDEGAQIRGVIWRSAASRIRFRLEEGQPAIWRACLYVLRPAGSHYL